VSRPPPASPSNPRGWRRSHGGNKRCAALPWERRKPRAFCHTHNLRRLQTLAAGAAPTAGTGTAALSRRSGASREPFVAPTTSVAFKPSRLAPLLQREQAPRRSPVGAAQAASFSSHPPTPVAFKPSRLTPLLQREQAPRRSPVGAAQAASFSSHPPTPVAFKPSRLAPLLQGDARREPYISRRSPLCAARGRPARNGAPCWSWCRRWRCRRTGH